MLLVNCALLRMALSMLDLCVVTMHPAASAERCDVITDTWTEMTDMIQDRTCFGAVTIGPAGLAEEQDLFDSLIDKALLRRP
jgi:hypothetical protein